jgi:chromosome segregation ATPase
MPAQLGAEYDFERLARSVALLVDQKRSLEAEDSELRRELQERTALAMNLEERLLEANQSRLDAAKRIDGLIAKLDRVEAALQRRGA